MTATAATPRAGTRPVADDLRTLSVACVAMLVSYLPFSGLNGILGRIAAQTGAATSDLQWLTSAFTVALAASVLPAGVLAGRYGPRRLARAGIALTATGAAAGWAVSLSGTLTGVRLLWLTQAVCGAGAGSGVAMATSSAVAVQAVAAPQAAIAGAANNALRQTGAALGPAVIGAVIAARAHHGGSAATGMPAAALAVAALLVLVTLATAALLTGRR
ncbi:MFS transporter [Couchioplanes caeruleus]|uniref:MFS transporter n=1 Tax=Couchioplanes caeruleus TaxID=56438 RepID=UPI00201C5A67|nr:MFS transporter [Couchioplanes caeruleus]UQU61748.1 MFS transporter [Couchioplanes caeruleus]